MFSFLAGFFEYMFLLLLIVIIHELGHLLIISMYGFKVSSIEIHCFGGITKYDSLLNESICKEMVIGLMGPVTQLLFYFLVYHLYLNGFVIESTFIKFKEINMILFYINLLPILFFDGGKLLNQILKLIFPFNLSNVICIYVSILTIPFLFMPNMFFISLLTIIFCIFKIIYEFKINKYKFNKFLVERLIYEFNFKKTIVVKSKYEFMCGKSHIINLKDKVMLEKEYLRSIMGSCDYNNLID